MNDLQGGPYWTQKPHSSEQKCSVGSEILRANNSPRHRRARQAYREHCVAWGGFDNIEQVVEWEDHSFGFRDQVEAYVELLVEFAKQEAGPQ
jgi:hypothetical protein